VPVFPLLPPIVNREFQEVPSDFPRHPARSAGVSGLNAVGGVRAIAGSWPVFAVDCGNPDFSSARRTLEMSLTPLGYPNVSHAISGKQTIMKRSKMHNRSLQGSGQLLRFCPSAELRLSAAGYEPQPIKPTKGDAP
jgi:hypothetical protein